MLVFKNIIAASAVAAALLGATTAIAQDQPPFGTPEEVDYANALWQQLAADRLVGPDAIAATTYIGGTGLHTETLISLQSQVTVRGNTGLAIVKKNFIGEDGEAATEEQVFQDPQKYLRVNTVMYQREAGYDADNQDWFWVVYTPAGDVVVNPLGLNMAGRIVGGGAMPDAPFNCVACHVAAPGDDFVFLHDAVPAR